VLGGKKKRTNCHVVSSCEKKVTKETTQQRLSCTLRKKRTRRSPDRLQKGFARERGRVAAAKHGALGREPASRGNNGVLRLKRGGSGPRENAPGGCVARGSEKGVQSWKGRWGWGFLVRDGGCCTENLYINLNEGGERGRFLACGTLGRC